MDVGVVCGVYGMWLDWFLFVCVEVDDVFCCEFFVVCVWWVECVVCGWFEKYVDVIRVSYVGVGV